MLSVIMTLAVAASAYFLGVTMERYRCMKLLSVIIRKRPTQPETVSVLESLNHDISSGYSPSKLECDG